MRDTTTRRRFLCTGLATAGSVLVAGCSGGGGSTDEPTDASGDGGGGDTGATTASTDSGGSESKWTQTSTVEMTDGLKYAPKRIEVSAGTTVTWKNVGSIGHTVTAYEAEIPDGATYFASGDFDSLQAAKDGYAEERAGNVEADGTYEHTFETKGTYKYYCIPHEMSGMVGYVKVV
jgi:plastocyanin